MAEKQSYEDKKLEAFRESLGEIDEIAQVTLKSHIFWLLPLPGAHSIGDPFMEIAWSYDCLYSCTPHIVSDRVAHPHESNSDPSGL